MNSAECIRNVGREYDAHVIPKSLPERVVLMKEDITLYLEDGGISQLPHSEFLRICPKRRMSLSGAYRIHTAVICRLHPFPCQSNDYHPHVEGNTSPGRMQHAARFRLVNDKYRGSDFTAFKEKSGIGMVKAYASV